MFTGTSPTTSLPKPPGGDWTLKYTHGIAIRSTHASDTKILLFFALGNHHDPEIAPFVADRSHLLDTPAVRDGLPRLLLGGAIQHGWLRIRP